MNFTSAEFLCFFPMICIVYSYLPEKETVDVAFGSQLFLLSVSESLDGSAAGFYHLSDLCGSKKNLPVRECSEPKTVALGNGKFLRGIAAGF